MPSLPPGGYGGKVPLLELCEGEVAELLQEPSRLVLPPDERPKVIPQPDVHASHEEWCKIAGELYRRGLVAAVKEPWQLDGQPVLNGAFGVVKPNKLTEAGQPVLRLIMDFRATNGVHKIITGDVRTLTGASAMQHVVMPEGKVLRMSAEDLVAAFYLFRLPQGWAERMCFQRKVPFQSLGIDQEGDTYIGATVLPMGWNSAVGVMQHAHRRLALRSPIRGGAGLLGMCEVRRDAIFPDLEHHEGIWSLYLDDTNVMEVLDAKLAQELEGTPADEQKRLRAAYEHWGIPTSLEKTVMRARKAEKLRGSTKRALESLSLGTWILGQERVARKALQVFCGKEVHTMQFRRPVFGVFDYIWKAIGDGREYVELGPKVVEEILMAGCLQVMRFTDLRAKLDPIVTASDACESGGGMVYSHKLTYEGLLEAVALEEGEADLPTEKMKIDDEQHILVIDFFAGIGGLSQALHLAGIKPDHTLVVEQDPDCRRLHRARWPGCEFINDITKLEKKDIEKATRRVPNLTGVISGGGSPCQGLSKLSSERQHLEDPRSALFFTLAKALDWVHELAKELNIWEIKFVENVVGDEEDKGEKA